MSVSAPIPPRKGSADKGSTKISTSASSSTILSQSAPPSALYNFRLLAALRSDDPTQVQPFLNQLKPGKSADEQEDLDKVGQILGMAVRVASVPIISMVLQSPGVSSPNVPVTTGSSTTALHVASEIGRAEVVQLLLNDPRIDDTVRDDRGRTPLECASNHEIANLIEESRAQTQAQFTTLLANYVSSQLSSPEESSTITDFLESPRVGIVNLNALDEKSGTSLLHEAARRRDLRLVELAVKCGADVFVRDKRNRQVLEGEKGQDERIKVFLRQFNNQNSLVEAKSDGRPPDLRGFLSKWVNYRSGWRTRWFVLENGVLSYYRNREDEQIACRGSIAMAVASLQASSDGFRFELSSKVSSAVPKFIVKSTHRAEIARWVQTLKLNIEFYQKGGPGAEVGVGSKAGSIAGTSQRLPKRSPSINTYSSKAAASAVESLPASDSFLSPKLKRSTTGLSGISVISTRSPVTPSSASFFNLSSLGPAVGGEDGDKDSISGSDDEEQPQGGDAIPHESAFELGVLNIKEQIKLTQQLIDSIVVSPPPGTVSPGGTGATATSSRQSAVKDALRESLATLATLMARQNAMSQERERFLANRVQREVQARQLWEENMLTIATQQAEFEKQLNEAAKDNEKKRKALRHAKGVLAELSGSSLPASPAVTEGVTEPSISQGILDAAPASATGALSSTPPLSVGSPTVASPTPLPGRAHRPSIPNIQEAHDAIVAAESDDEDDHDDEFFDAIEQGSLPNMKLYDSIAHPEKDRPGTPGAMERRGSTILDVQRQPRKGTIEEYLGRNSLEPYLHVRNRLPIDDDKRPSVSLWSILKSSVGKDLTKISFPVSFNECTSMLQRMAEDMEYDACLTVAAAETDSMRRLAFVAAFAMSNYSSTIGRVAKPFNPLLSQSFEYAIPNRYRYISEQVSHHPPISACYSEAPTWKYYGEVDAQNKFQGRSFEIRPTGVAHAELAIPKEWVKPGLEYPAAGPEYGEGFVMEHYSWKKVTTNVSNFIMGSPIIDHYGDLVVTNHRTGESCTLTFKPRGWRGKDAMEIKGQVVDSAGQVAWDIAGRWNSQLIARKAEATTLPLDFDTTFGQEQKEYILLWRNSEKPKAPFNLTPFAITLNDIPQGLGDYLCPTDCRLRTDQRAFENAEYDRAQALKTLNEEKQRLTRKLRAEGKLPPHEPQWFREVTDEDSGERLWEPKRSESGEVLFWAEREKRHWEEIGVEHIFAED